VDPQQQRERMLALEKLGDGGRPLDETVAAILGLGYDEGFGRSYAAEAFRTQILCREHYTPSVAVLPNELQMAVAIAQGVTFAVAALQDRLEAAAALADAVRALDSYAALGGAPMERTERADAALRRWEALQR
jgi:hypothetical protein